ncbi:hypothetical protein IQ07DRAFT_633850 [Pyrenochaeta sp. DS3sAY3a]|nr:hypothetical protein IQ07DRAFT_633850 [Pyrenochaeta sp. DS3sAY3a]
MIDSDSPCPYEEQYYAALKFMEDGEEEKCVAACKRNLLDPTLPTLYMIRNCLLVACACETWDEGDVYRRAAEEMYNGQFEEATQKCDKDALEALEILRSNLDECNDSLDALLSEETGIWISDGYAEREEMLAEMDSDEFDTYDSDTELEMEEQNAVREVENNDEFAAESMTLPIRETTSPTSAMPIITVNSSVENFTPTTSISK